MKLLKAAAALLLSSAVFVGVLAGCSGYVKYTGSFFGTFDTVVEVVAYKKSYSEFEVLLERVRNRFTELSHIFDIYESYDALNNVKTINDNAGIAPVAVPAEIINVLTYSKQWYSSTGGKVNVALGPVLSIWHDYRERGLDNPEAASLPSAAELSSAFELCDIEDVVIDRGAGTVFLKKPGMSLDLGAVAKGYACELVAAELRADGESSCIINAGGNVCVIGRPISGAKKRFSVGIQNPDAGGEGQPDTIDAVYGVDISVVTSGDYQRYYTVDGKRYHHIIDPDTLMPAGYYRSVTVVTRNSALADILSTALFLMPFDKGLRFVNNIGGTDAIWIFADGSVKTTAGMSNMLESLGAK